MSEANLAREECVYFPGPINTDLIKKSFSFVLVFPLNLLHSPILGLTAKVMMDK